jgi:hypothetical protein
MKTYTLFFVLVFSLMCCSEDEEQKKIVAIENQEPPFSEYWFSTLFDLTESKEVTNFKFLNTWAGNTKSLSDEGYIYYSTGQIPAGITQTILINGDVLTFKSIGKMPRLGSRVPSGYDGEATDWSDPLNFDLQVTANISTKTVTKAILKLDNDFFALEYDLITIMDFTEHDQDNIPEWTIMSNQAGIKALDQFRVAISVWDVYGTAIKK